MDKCFWFSATIATKSQSEERLLWILQNEFFLMLIKIQILNCRFFVATWRGLKAIHVNLRVKSFAFYIRRIFLFKYLYGQYSKSKWFTESFSLDYIFGVIRKHKNRMSKQFEIFKVFRTNSNRCWNHFGIRFGKMKTFINYNQ